MITAYFITLRFVREPGILSWLIDRGTGGFLTKGARWSHVGTLIKGSDPALAGWNVHNINPDIVYEFGARSDVIGSLTGKAGVQLRPQNYATFVEEESICIPLNKDEWDSFWKLALSVYGVAYSNATIESFIVGNMIQDKTVAFDCSGLASWLMLNCSKTLFPQGVAARIREISPNALYDMARVIQFYRHQT